MAKFSLLTLMNDFSVDISKDFYLHLKSKALEVEEFVPGNYLIPMQTYTDEDDQYIALFKTYNVPTPNVFAEGGGPIGNIAKALKII